MKRNLIFLSFLLPAIAYSQDLIKKTLTGVDGNIDNFIKYGYKYDLESSGSIANRWHGIDATITAGAAESNKMHFKLYSGTSNSNPPITVMTLQGDRKVGINFQNPTSTLTVYDAGPVGSNQFELRSNHLRNPDRYFMKNIIYGTGSEDVTFFLRHDGQMFVDGNVGIGTTVIENSEGWNKVLQIRGNEHSKILASSSNVITGLWAHNYGFYGAPAGGITGTYTNHPFSFITNGSNKMTIFSNGKVTIGTSQPDSDPNFLLYVKKGIKAEQVKVEIASANGWADYVFNKNYKLLSLSDVEKHIDEKGHLPNIPSADDVVKNGINLGEMDAKLLEKIEELTLYVIQLNKDVKKLEEENKQLKQKGILTE